MSDIQKAFALLRKDFEKYASFNLKIVDKNAKLISFAFNRMQRVLWMIYQKDLAAAKPIRWYITKSRQLGSTTFGLALTYWRATMNHHHTALLLNYDTKSSENLGGKIQSFYMQSNPVLKPQVRKMNRGEIHFATPLTDFEKSGEVGLDSRILITTADSENLGRSYTFQTILMSEFSLWEDQGIDVLERMIALNSAMPETSDSLVILETTPNGEGFAKDFWDDNENGYRKIFISWLADETYRIELTESEHETVDLSEDKDGRYGNEVYERSLIIEQLRFWYPEYSDNLFWLNREANCRVIWRRTMIDRKLGGRKEAFDKEYPTSPEKMFAGSNASIFGGFIVQERINKVLSNNLKPLRFSYNHDDATQDATRKFFADRYGKLFVYEPIEEDGVYVIGADAAQGIEGGDESSLLIWKVPELREVAMFSDIIRPDVYAGVVHYLSVLYNNALNAVEVNDKGGYTCVNHMQTTYRNRNMYSTVGTGNSISYGWKTNEVTRQMMVNNLMTLFADDVIQIRSIKLLEQMKTFVRGKNGKPQAAAGKKDDLVLAAMIGLMLAGQAKLPMERPQPKAPMGSLDWYLQQLPRSAVAERYNRGR